jgi:hypothetical protein
MRICKICGSLIRDVPLFITIVSLIKGIPKGVFPLVRSPRSAGQAGEQSRAESRDVEG